VYASDALGEPRLLPPRRYIASYINMVLAVLWSHLHRSSRRDTVHRHHQNNGKHDVDHHRRVRTVPCKEFLTQVRRPKIDSHGMSTALFQCGCGSPHQSPLQARLPAVTLDRQSQGRSWRQLPQPRNVEYEIDAHVYCAANSRGCMHCR
jgi:hypothetical protein